MVRRSHAVWAPSWLVVDPELNGSLQVLHLFEPPSIMDLAATEVKAGSHSRLNFKVPSARPHDAPHDGRANGVGGDFYHLDGRCRAAGRWPSQSERERAVKPPFRQSRFSSYYCDFRGSSSGLT
jgi:hypothetical protein